MKIIHSRLIYLLFMLCAAVVGAQTEKNHRVSDFVINPNLPFVYLKIDHVGPGEPRNDDESNMRVWLQLINNCRVPIIVHTFGVPEGSPEYEQGVMYEVVANPPVFGAMVMHFPAGRPPKVGDQKETPPTRKNSDEVPRGYMLHVGSFQSLAPDEAILLSVPANHFDERWHLEIPVEFDLPKGEGHRDPRNGGLPKMVIEYSLADLPTEVRKEIKKN